MDKVKLKEICRLINGRAYRQDELLDSGKYPVLRVGNFFSDKDYYYSDLELEEDKYCDNGDLLFAWSASFGPKIWDGGKVIYHYHIWKMELSEQVQKEYLYYYLSYLSEKIKSEGHGGIMIHTTKAEMEEREFYLPNLIEQKQKADILHRISSIINHRKAELNALDELVKARFVEMFGDLASPDCEWNAIKLVDACSNPDDIKCGPFGTQLSKDEYTDSGVAVWEIPQINSAFKTAPTHFLKEEKADQLSAYSLVPGDIAMSRKGNVGKCALFPYGYADGIIHSDVLRIRVEQKNVNPVFMMCQLHFSGAVTRQIELVSLGAIMAGVNVTKLKQIYVHIPPMELQNQFADFVKQVDKSKVVVQKALDKAQLLFDSLMQKYFG